MSVLKTAYVRLWFHHLYVSVTWRPQNQSGLTKHKRIQLTGKILTYMEILDRYSECQVLYLIQVAKCTKYLSGILPTTKWQLLFLEMLEMVGIHETVRYWNIMHTWSTAGIHKTVKYWNVIYMTCSRYTQNCQILKCCIHDL